MELNVVAQQKRHTNFKILKWYNIHCVLVYILNSQSHLFHIHYFAPLCYRSLCTRRTSIWFDKHNCNASQSTPGVNGNTCKWTYDAVYTVHGMLCNGTESMWETFVMVVNDVDQGHFLCFEVFRGLFFNHQTMWRDWAPLCFWYGRKFQLYASVERIQRACRTCTQNHIEIGQFHSEFKGFGDLLNVFIIIIKTEKAVCEKRWRTSWSLKREIETKIASSLSGNELPVPKYWHWCKKATIIRADPRAVSFMVLLRPFSFAGVH